MSPEAELIWKIETKDLWLYKEESFSTMSQNLVYYQISKTVMLWYSLRYCVSIPVGKFPYLPSKHIQFIKQY